MLIEHQPDLLKMCEHLILMPWVRKSPCETLPCFEKSLKYPIFRHLWPVLWLQYSSLCEQATANTSVIRLAELSGENFLVQYLKSCGHDPNKYISKTAGGALALFVVTLGQTTLH